MSVPSWKRTQAASEYVYRIYLLNIRLGEILINKPKKYKANYADAAIHTALSALENAQLADSISLPSSTSLQQDYVMRREALLLARGQLIHLATCTEIFLEIVRKHDYQACGSPTESARLAAKLYEQELEVGALCDQCCELITQTLKADRSYIKAMP